MKQMILFLCVALLASFHATGQGYAIVGEAVGLDGQTVTLKQYRDLQPFDVATATIKDGKFTFEGHSAFPEFTMLFIGNQGPLQFFVENSNIRILIDKENIGQSVVAGSKENDVFKEFIDGLEKFAKQQKLLNDSYVSLRSSSVASPDAEMNIRVQMEKLNEDRNALMVSHIQKYPNRTSTAFIIISVQLLQVIPLTNLEVIAQGFDPKTAQSQWVKTIKDYVASQKRTDVGQPFLDITLKTPDDQPISISDYAGKGKYVLLDFWAAWCGPCRSENPRIVQLYNKYKDKGFEIVGISLDQSKEAWVKAIQDDKISWPQMSDLKYWQSAAAQLYSVSAIPFTMLLDKDGKIMAKGLRADGLTVKLAELLD